MFISLWVLIPAVIVVILGSLQNTRNVTKLERMTEDQQINRQALKELREEVEEYYRQECRADSAFEHIANVAFDGERDATLAAVRDAKRFWREKGKSWQDAPWR